MSLKKSNLGADKLSEDGEDSYVDPILFAEGIYLDQDDYEHATDDFADRINTGLIPKRGREPKSQLNNDAYSAEQHNNRTSLVKQLLEDAETHLLTTKGVKDEIIESAERALLAEKTNASEKTALTKGIAERKYAAYKTKPTVFREAIQRLPPEQRLIIELLYFGGFNQREVAEELGISLSIVKSRLLAALKVLTKVFE